jgi:hypothetical protein
MEYEFSKSETLGRGDGADGADGDLEMGTRQRLGFVAKEVEEGGGMESRK